MSEPVKGRASVSVWVWAMAQGWALGSVRGRASVPAWVWAMAQGWDWGRGKDACWGAAGGLPVLPARPGDPRTHENSPRAPDRSGSVRSDRSVGVRGVQTQRRQNRSLPAQRQREVQQCRQARHPRGRASDPPPSPEPSGAHVPRAKPSSATRPSHGFTPMRPVALRPRITPGLPLSEAPVSKCTGFISYRIHQ